MRRLLPWSLPCLVVAALTTWWMWPVPSARPDTRVASSPEARRPLPPAVRSALPAPQTEAPPSAPPITQESQPLAERARAIRDACGLPLQTHCEGESCVVFAETPSMDGLEGWLQLGWSSPAFVGSVLARDAGVRTLPCPAAIDGLELSAIRMLPTATGEVWCTGTGPAHRELCERATGVSGFTDETRLLRF